MPGTSTTGDIEWLECGDDDPMLVQRIHKNRIVGPTFQAKTIEDMANVPLRDDDILVCSYPKSGCHWIWDNIRMILAGEVLADSVQKEQLMMELCEDQKNLEKFPSPRILNNHVYFDDQPTDLLKGKTKVILIYRNPKDLCVSFYNHHTRIPSYKYKGKFSNYIHRFLQGKLSAGKCFDYWKQWEQGLQDNPNIPVHIVSYEDFHRNPISERSRLASFLGGQCDDEFLQKVAEATSLDNMRQHKKEVSLKDADGLPIMYRKGKVGDWKNHFTVGESEMFDKVVEKEMEGSQMFHFVYSLD